jgi:hypothetical protein
MKEQGFACLLGGHARDTQSATRRNVMLARLDVTSARLTSVSISYRKKSSAVIFHSAQRVEREIGTGT